MMRGWDATMVLLTAFLAMAPGMPGADFPIADFIGRHCAECHEPDTAKGGLDLESIRAADIAQRPAEWEKVIRKLRARQMPPPNKGNRPAEADYALAVSHLESVLDAAALAQPRPGRTETLRRLTRTEYQNAIRDLLALEIDASTWLPAEELSHGFDNITVGTLSPTLLDRYLTAARKISRLAVGAELRTPAGETFRVRPDITQEDRVDGLPFGTRGGVVIPYHFPREGQYEITIRLARDRNEMVEGLNEAHELVVLLDRAQVRSFTVKPVPEDRGQEQVDAHLTCRVPVKAGPRQLGVTFVKNPASLLETKRQPYESHFNHHRHPRLGPAIFQVSVTGPHEPGDAGDTPSRRRIFTAPDGKAALGSLLRRAWRRPVGEEDAARLMPFYEEGGMQAALEAILVSREFLFRAEPTPAGIAPGTVYRISDVQLASRLSFFLWSSIPDEELIALAERDELHRPEVLAAQTRRLLADPRSQSLVTNFAAQWLHLRNLDSVTPDGRLFPDFDDNLRQAFRRETEMHVEEILREDRSILGLLKSDHTYLNERLAKHYGIPNIYGPHFRRVDLPADSPRGGLLRQGSVLTVTSYATRTSPVLRGKWILENLLGTPPPPPPADVPALEENTVAAGLSVRERLAEHRANAACASCHQFMDPPGFALENFDAVGRWRTREGDLPVDAAGGLPDGSMFQGVEGLEAGLLSRPELFAGVLTEKLLTFALGRGLEPSDAPAVREIVRVAREKDYRFSEIIAGIVRSVPFTMRESSP